MKEKIMFYITEILDVHPFQDPYIFSYRNAMDNLLSDQPRLSIYNKIFLNLHYNLNDKIFNMKCECVRSIDLGLSLKSKKKRSVPYSIKLCY